jgi:hypothetical protein
MKGEGGITELVNDYGMIILILLVIILMFVAFISLINSHPEYGITLPDLFGGGSSGGGGAGGG